MDITGIGSIFEFGGKVLGPMIKRIEPEAANVSLVSMADVEALLGTL